MAADKPCPQLQPSLHMEACRESTRSFHLSRLTLWNVNWRTERKAIKRRAKKQAVTDHRVYQQRRRLELSCTDFSFIHNLYSRTLFSDAQNTVWWSSNKKMTKPPSVVYCTLLYVPNRETNLARWYASYSLHFVGSFYLPVGQKITK